MNESKIAKLMKSLDLTREEAIEMIADDEAIDKGEKLFELNDEQKKAAKKATKTGTRKSSSSKRERKIDTNKELLFNFFLACIREDLFEGEIVSTKTETEINLMFRNEPYSLRLIKHRPKKNEGAS